MTLIEHTDQTATDEAVLLFTRKMRNRMSKAAYAEVLKVYAALPDGAVEALQAAELRADTRRSHDERNGVARTYVPRYALMD